MCSQCQYSCLSYLLFLFRCLLCNRKLSIYEILSALMKQKIKAQLWPWRLDIAFWWIYFIFIMFCWVIRCLHEVMMRASEASFTHLHDLSDVRFFPSYWLVFGALILPCSLLELVPESLLLAPQLLRLNVWLLAAMGTDYAVFFFWFLNWLTFVGTLSLDTFSTLCWCGLASWFHISYCYLIFLHIAIMIHNSMNSWSFVTDMQRCTYYRVTLFSTTLFIRINKPWHKIWVGWSSIVKPTVFSTVTERGIHAIFPCASFLPVSLAFPANV